MMLLSLLPVVPLVVIPIAMLPSFAIMLILGFRLISREVRGESADRYTELNV